MPIKVPNKAYDFDGRIYIQRPLMLAQFFALLRVLDGLEFRGNMTAMEIMRTLDENGRLLSALAVVLIEEKQDLREALADMNERICQIECGLSLEQTVEVIEDFFDYNPISSLVKRIGAMMANIRRNLPTPQIPESSNAQSSTSSPGETSQNAMQSFGKSKPRKQEHGSI